MLFLRGATASTSKWVRVRSFGRGTLFEHPTIPQSKNAIDLVSSLISSLLNNFVFIVLSLYIHLDSININSSVDKLNKLRIISEKSCLNQAIISWIFHDIVSRLFDQTYETIIYEY